MKVVVVNPTERTVKMIDVEHVPDAYEIVGIKSGQVDFGVVYRTDNNYTINIIVYEFGLLNVPPEEGHYFAIGTQLYEGGAVLFAADDHGETIPMPPEPPPVMFYRSHEEVEAAIRRGEINRPHTAVNGMLLWQWGKP